MEHPERITLAETLTRRMADTHPLLIGGVYGSTAREEDTPWSDLELWFVVEDGCAAAGKHILYKNTAVGWRVYQVSELLQILAHPDARWPFHMGVLDVLHVLHGDPARVKKWLKYGMETPGERFTNYLADRLPELVVESHGRVHASARRGDFATARYGVIEVLFEMRTALCLLNRRWVTRDYDAGLLQVCDFPKLPAGYAEALPALLEARSFDCLPILDRLVDQFWQLMIDEGIEVRNYQHADRIPL